MGDPKMQLLVDTGDLEENKENKQAFDRRADNRRSKSTNLTAEHYSGELLDGTQNRISGESGAPVQMRPWSRAIEDIILSPAVDKGTFVSSTSINQ